MPGSSGPACALEPLRVFVTADAVGGVWQYALDLLDGLTRRGCEALLAVMGPPPSREQWAQANSIRRLQVVSNEFALEWMQTPWRDVDAAGNWLLELARDFVPDIVHLNGYAHAILDWRRPVVVTAHSCVYSWWHAVHGCEPGPEWDHYQQRVRAGLTSATAVVAPSHALAGTLEHLYGLEAGTIHVIPNFSGVETRGTAAKEPFCLAAGRFWDEAKNLTLLEDIAGEAPWPIYVAGSCVRPGGQAYSASRLRVLGHISHVEFLEYAGRASLFLHPALYEPFGLAVLEAAQAGCALVLSDIPTLRELWDGAAAFVSPRDADWWLDTLERLASHEAERARLAERARTHAARYSEAVSVSTYLSLYRAIHHHGAMQPQITGASTASGRMH